MGGVCQPATCPIAYNAGVSGRTSLRGVRQAHRSAGRCPGTDVDRNGGKGIARGTCPEGRRQAWRERGLGRPAPCRAGRRQARGKTPGRSGGAIPEGRPGQGVGEDSGVGQGRQGRMRGTRAPLEVCDTLSDGWLGDDGRMGRANRIISGMGSMICAPTSAGEAHLCDPSSSRRRWRNVSGRWRPGRPGWTERPMSRGRARARRARPAR